VLGTAAVGESYNGANTLPNMVYELLIGGVLSSAVLPLLMRARVGSLVSPKSSTHRTRPVGCTRL